jgi:hypothetical protein
MNIESIDVEKEIGRVGKIICEHDVKKGILIPILHRIQEDCGPLRGLLKGIENHQLFGQR